MTKEQFNAEFLDPAQVERDAAAAALSTTQANLDAVRLAHQAARDRFEAAQKRIQAIRDLRALIYPGAP
ncbi:MAG TPA: hypothetical protein VLA89_14020 [Gemmatimonadales bacterium]|nr:hypothetical protein [Gemmatimonadales bacterium]